MEHLPECPHDQSGCQYAPDVEYLLKCYYCGEVCICDALRACEQRVIAEGDELVGLTAFRSYRKGYTDGVNDAEKIIVDRIHDLATCNKHEDCITQSEGAALTLSDIQHWRAEEKQ